MEEAVKSQYEAVVGLEIHAQLLTESKIFSWDSTEYGQMPNTNITEVTLGHPGTLPMLNKRAVEYAMKLGIATECELKRYCYFDRKNYFYPDLPKGYQISQDQTPLCRNGRVPVTLDSGEEKFIGLHRIHMEEDAGKSLHLEDEHDTLVDLNRCGVPLIEMVTEPDIRTSEQAYKLLTEIRRLLRYLEICDGNMEEGSLRCDANISVRKKGTEAFGKKVEVKNMNSIRNVQRAIEFEINRQIEDVEAGKDIPSETRQFNAETGTTHALRTKEELNDYRYFPEPDLQPFKVTEEWVQEVQQTLPPLPRELYRKFVEEYGLPEYDAGVLSDNKGIALFFEEICNHTKNYKAASNWLMGPVKSHLNELATTIDRFPLSSKEIADLIQLVDEGKVSHSVASNTIYPEMLKDSSKTAQQYAEEMNLIQESDESSLQPVIEEIIAKYPEKVQEYKGGKTGIISMFMGEVMKSTKGKADPKKANQLLKEMLE